MDMRGSITKRLPHNQNVLLFVHAWNLVDSELLSNRVLYGINELTSGGHLTSSCHTHEGRLQYD